MSRFICTRYLAKVALRVSFKKVSKLKDVGRMQRTFIKFTFFAPRKMVYLLDSTIYCCILCLLRRKYYKSSKDKLVKSNKRTSPPPQNSYNNAVFSNMALTVVLYEKRKLNHDKILRIEVRKMIVKGKIIKRFS